MNIVIFGASGRVGQEVTRRALSTGHTVTAFVHNSNPFEDTPVRVVQGDVSDFESVRAAMQGCDAVISTLGSWKTKEKNIVSTGAQTIIRAMQDLGMKRIILLTGSGAYWSGDKLRPIDTTSHLLLKIINRGVLIDGEAAIGSLEQSNLDWTIVRAPAIKQGAPRPYILNNVIGSPLSTTTRATVANVLFDQLEDHSWIHQAPVIHSAK